MFKWIQLSDLHFQDNEYQDVKKARNSLPKYLGTVIKKCDAIFILGDFRYAAKSEGNIKEIASYINEIKQSVQAEYVVCVPGNHDLNRSVLRDSVIDGIVNGNGYNPYRMGKFDEEVLKVLQEGFVFYKELCNEINTPYYIKMSNTVHEVFTLSNCNLVLLNTAIIAGKEQERGSLVLGTGYLDDVLKKIDKEKPTIVMGHHGASFWEREEQKCIYDLFEQNGVKLFLCGHEHALYSESIGNGKPIMQITTGCIKSDTDSNWC